MRQSVKVVSQYNINDPHYIRNKSHENAPTIYQTKRI
jgi:hypothetical protein